MAELYLKCLRTLLAGLLLVTVGVHAEPAKLALPDMDGNPHSLADLRGKWVVVNFWATWCPPCIEEIPELVLFHEANKDKGAVVWGVNFEDIDAAGLNDFLEDFFVTYPISMMRPAGVTPLGPIMGLPTTFVVDPEGKLVAKQTGPVTAEMLENFIEKKNNQR
ncbi:MAG: TlpA disulfide reductase family protein [Gammaproteobacteria bacterium]|nr:TlpA disulfide reductase family protein [Gammaproteobacteria bacterium]